MTESLRQKTFNATKWASVLTVAQQVSRILLYFVLAMILGPETFGLAARVLAVALILDMASEFGFVAALVQREDLTRRHIETAFVSNMAIAIGIGTLGFAGVHLWAWLTSPSEFLDVLQYVVFLPVVFALGHVQRALLTRDLNFRSQTIATMTGSLVYLIVAIGLALAGAGVWAIIIGYYANHFVVAALYWHGSKWRPRLLFGRKEFTDLVSFGLFHSMSGLANAFARGTDVLVIGAVLGDVAAGLYSMGLRVGGLAVGQVGAVLNRVLFTSFSRLQGNNEALSAAYLKATRYLAVVATAALVLTYAAAPLVPLLIGDKWTNMVPIARIMCFSVVWLGLGATLVPPVLTAIGRSDWEFVIGIIQISLLVIAVWIGVQYGIRHTAVAVAIQQAIFCLTMQGFVVYGIRIRYLDYVRRISDVFLGFALSALTVHLIHAWFGGVELGWRVLLESMVTVPAALGVYLGVLHAFDRSALREVIGIVGEVVGSRRVRSSSES